ncbi:holo-ACP synthase [Xanthobacter sediminis]|uniref:holo-ACP synthase n=1 Tax=Xanthobacter sediminis TaxID=3119926 RepID=UPI0037273D1D
MNVVAIGIDIVDIERFDRLYGNFDSDVLNRCFTAEEQAEVGADADRLVRLAARFAAKEAVLKTIGGLQDGISLTDIEIVSNGTMPPIVKVAGGALSAATKRGVSSWQISLTHATHNAAAVALAFGASPM